MRHQLLSIGRDLISDGLLADYRCRRPSDRLSKIAAYLCHMHAEERHGGELFNPLKIYVVQGGLDRRQLPQRAPSWHMMDWGNGVACKFHKRRHCRAYQ